MAGFDRRLAFLERHSGLLDSAMARCPECGRHPAGGPPDGPLQVTVRFAKEGETGSGPEHCVVCGALRRVRITFDSSG